MNLTRFQQIRRGGIVLGLSAGFACLVVRAGTPADTAALAAANTGFAFNLLKQIAGEQPKANVFISPFSVSSVLQMIANGAAGETKAELERVLQTGSLPPAALNAAGKYLNESLIARTNAILDLANALWYQEGVRLKPGFVTNNQDFFGAKLAGVDFAKPAAAQLINDWADQSTRGKIREIVRWPFPPLTRLVLANAIYFKGSWEHPFDKQATQLHDFRLADGKTEQTPLMWQRRHFGYQAGNDFQAVQLPYAGGRLQMYLFLPATNSSPAQFLAGLDAGTWRDKILPRFVDREGTLAMPRFQMEFEAVLNDPLKALGLRNSFTPAANFSAMAAEPLFVSEVKQKSYVDVNEKGTEAAAVTVGIMRATAILRPEPPFEMVVDRPFFFVISDQETRSILFMGIVYNPAGQGGGS